MGVQHAKERCKLIKGLGIDVPRSVSFESEERYFFATIRYKKLRFKG